MGLTEPVIRQQAASAIQLVIDMSRLRDGTRKVTGIAEVIGVDHEGVILKEIFRFEQSGVDQEKRVIGRFLSTGYQPQFLERLHARGIEVQANSWFS
jgi:pilus assembly protein CpaF